MIPTVTLLKTQLYRQSIFPLFELFVCQDQDLNPEISSTNKTVLYNA